MAIMSSCSMFKPRCPIQNCHILKRHTHPYVFDKKKFKGDKKNKNRRGQEAVDSSAFAADTLASSGTHVLGSLDQSGDTLSEVTEDQVYEEDDVLSPEDELEEDKKKKKKKEKVETKEEDQVEWKGSWEEDLWKNGLDALDGLEDDDDEDDLGEELTGDEEALEENVEDEKDVKKEIKDAEKAQKKDEKNSKKLAKAEEKLQKRIKKKWRSNVTPWFRKNQNPKIGEKWKGPNHQTENGPEGGGETKKKKKFLLF